MGHGLRDHTFLSVINFPHPVLLLTLHIIPWASPCHFTIHVHSTGICRCLFWTCLALVPGKTRNKAQFSFIYFPASPFPSPRWAGSILRTQVMSYVSMCPLGKTEHLAPSGYLADPELEMALGMLTLLLSLFALLSSWTQHPLVQPSRSEDTARLWG